MADPRGAPFRFWSFFFSLQGRVSRWPFLAFELITRLSMLAVSADLSHNPRLPLTSMILYSLLVGLIGFVVLWPNFALMFKRFHDGGVTGLWALAYFVPLIYGGYLAFVSVNDPSMLKHAIPAYANWALTGFNFGLVAIVFLLPGSKTANRYGPRRGDPTDQISDVF